MSFILRKTNVFAALVFTLVAADPASAGIILPTSQASEVVFNFDFSAGAFPPNYSQIHIFLDFKIESESAADGKIFADIFGSLDGNPPLAGSADEYLAGDSGITKAAGTYNDVFIFSLNSSPGTSLDDGIFSLGLYTNVSVPVELNKIVAKIRNNEGNVVLEREGVQSVSAVPEPGSLTLLGIGALSLAGFGWRRRKTAKQASHV